MLSDIASRAYFEMAKRAQAGRALPHDLQLLEELQGMAKRRKTEWLRRVEP